VESAIEGWTKIGVFHIELSERPYYQRGKEIETTANAGSQAVNNLEGDTRCFFVDLRVLLKAFEILADVSLSLLMLFISPCNEGLEV
jgi:hypothetical protein